MRLVKRGCQYGIFNIRFVRIDRLENGARDCRAFRCLIMKIAIVKYCYAPELTRVQILDKKTFRIKATLPAPNVENVRGARKALFKPAKKGLLITAKKIYPEGFENLNSTTCGLFKFGRFRGAIKEMRHIKKSLIASSGAGKILLDGRIMPAPKIVFSLKLIG